MEIRDYAWNSFLGPVKTLPKEGPVSYFARLSLCLDAFVRQNGWYPEEWPDGSHEPLLYGICPLNFSGLIVRESGEDVDVKYTGNYDSATQGYNGIMVYCHKEDQERREPQVDLLRRMFREFKYDIEQ